MKRLNYTYMGQEEKQIPDKEDLFKSGIPAASKLRSMITTIQRIFKTTGKNIKLSIIGSEWFKIEVYDSKRSLICMMYYNPVSSRLDLYDSPNLMSPMFVWNNRQCVIKNIGPTLGTLRVETLFLPIISYL